MSLNSAIFWWNWYKFYFQSNSRESKLLTGNQGKLFEKEFANWSNNNYSIAMANGSLALWYISFFKFKKDDKAHNPRTFIATSSELINSGLRPVFADVNRDPM